MSTPSSLSCEAEKPDERLIAVAAKMIKSRNACAQQALKASKGTEVAREPPPHSTSSDQAQSISSFVARRNNAKTAATPDDRAVVLLNRSIGNYDVLCQRSREAFNHVGNRRFRLLVELHTPTYAQLTSRTDRSMALLTIINTIRHAGGEFWTKCNKHKSSKSNSTTSTTNSNNNNNISSNQWVLCTEIQAKEKVGHAFRHAMAAAKSGQPRTIYEILGDVDLITPISLHPTSPPIGEDNSQQTAKRRRQSIETIMTTTTTTKAAGRLQSILKKSKLGNSSSVDGAVNSEHVDSSVKLLPICCPPTTQMPSLDAVTQAQSSLTNKVQKNIDFESRQRHRPHQRGRALARCGLTKKHEGDLVRTKELFSDHCEENIREDAASLETAEQLVAMTRMKPSTDTITSSCTEANDGALRKLDLLIQKSLLLEEQQDAFPQSARALPRKKRRVTTVIDSSSTPPLPPTAAASKDTTTPITPLSLLVVAAAMTKRLQEKNDCDQREGQHESCCSVEMYDGAQQQDSTLCDVADGATSGLPYTVAGEFSAYQSTKLNCGPRRVSSVEQDHVYTQQHCSIPILIPSGCCLSNNNNNCPIIGGGAKRVSINLPADDVVVAPPSCTLQS